MKLSRLPPGDEVLRAAAEVIEYEFYLMRLPLKLVDAVGFVVPHELRIVEPNLPRVTRTIFIDSSLLHARNVLDFLFPRSPYDDDVLARDYSHAWEDSTDERMISGVPIETIRERLNKHVAHLTYERARAPEPDWPEGMLAELGEFGREWYHSMLDERKEWFSKGIMTM